MDEMSRREIEIKLRLNDAAEQEAMAARLEQLGFVSEQAVEELDYVPDTVGYGCRKAGLMVRFRRVTCDGRPTRILLTFKKKYRDAKFIVADETEFYLDEPDAEAWRYINLALVDAGVKPLPDGLLGGRDFMKVIELAFKGGYAWFRILVEKRRQLWRRGELVATIDELPNGIGRFIELEAHSEQQLDELMAELGLPVSKLERLDYGDIIMRHNGSDDMIGRTAVFDEDIREAVYRLAEGELV